jgi:hypothetical protein
VTSRLGTGKTINLFSQCTRKELMCARAYASGISAYAQRAHKNLKGAASTMSQTASIGLSRAEQRHSSIFWLLFAHHKRGSMKGVYLVLYGSGQYIALALERLSGAAKHELNSLP